MTNKEVKEFIDFFWKVINKWSLDKYLKSKTLGGSAKTQKEFREEVKRDRKKMKELMKKTERIFGRRGR